MSVISRETTIAKERQDSCIEFPYHHLHHLHQLVIH